MTLFIRGEVIKGHYRVIKKSLQLPSEQRGSREGESEGDSEGRGKGQEGKEENEKEKKTYTLHNKFNF